MKKIKEVLSLDTGTGSGSGYGYGYGDGLGYGYGLGYGTGSGHGDGDGTGDGSGNWSKAGAEITNNEKPSSKRREEMKGKIPCLITTDKDKRGVFMGFIDPEDVNKEEIEAEEVRMAVYWDASTKGVLGLAATGPGSKCRISPAVKKALIKGVTAAFEITDEALEKWRKEPWG